MKPLKVYIGYDPIDDKAFNVCRYSLLKHATIPVEIIPIWDRPLREEEIYWRGVSVDNGLDNGLVSDKVNGQMYDRHDGRPFSSAFSFARFAVPIVANYTDDLVLFCDPDMLWRGDIADLLDDSYVGKSLWCVQHNHEPEEDRKMYGCVQTQYFRKNWSSFMLMRPSKCKRMNTFRLNHWTGGDLHALRWLNEDEIGALDERWNWLEGWSKSTDPKVVHFTRGTPDMIGSDIPFAGEWWDSYIAALEAEVNELKPQPLAEVG